MSPARPTAVTLAGASLRYADQIALHEVDLQVPVGSTAAVVGPTDAGKSTLVRLILELVAPDAGTVRVDLPAGAVLQPFGLHPRRTVRGQLRVHAAATGTSPERVAALLTRTQLVTLADTRIQALRDGQKLRLAVAIALLSDPPLLVFDDPLAELDANDRSWLYEVLREHSRRGGTTVLTSRSLAAALPVSDTVTVLRAGVVVYRGDPRQLRESHPDRVIVSCSSPIALATALAGYGFTDTVMRSDGRLAVADATYAQVELAAQSAGVQLIGMVPEPIHPDRVLTALTRTTRQPSLDGTLP